MRLRRNTEETYAFIATFKPSFHRDVREFTTFLRSVPGCDVNDVVDESGSGFPSIQVMGEAPASQAERVALVCNIYLDFEDVIFPSLNEEWSADGLNERTFKPGDKVETIFWTATRVTFATFRVVKKNRTRYALKDENDRSTTSPPALLRPLPGGK
jgi:hypothetical protein